MLSRWFLPVSLQGDNSNHADDTRKKWEHDVVAATTRSQGTAAGIGSHDDNSDIESLFGNSNIKEKGVDRSIDVSMKSGCDDNGVIVIDGENFHDTVEPDAAYSLAGNKSNNKNINRHSQEKVDFAEETSTNANKPKSYWKRVNDSFGSHHLTDTVFTITVISNRSMRLSLFIIYALFFASLILGTKFLYQRRSGIERIPLAVPDAKNASNYCYAEDPFKEYNWSSRDGCYSSAGVKLSMNTGVVDSGLNVSNWRGTGAVPGTPPFQSLTSSGYVMESPDILDFDANPQLHYIWNDITAMVWLGHSSSMLQTKMQKLRTFTIDLELVKTNGVWSSDILNESFGVRTEAYGCLANDVNCSSIGSFRKILVNEKIDDEVPRYHDGNTYRARLMAYNHYIGWQRIESWGWRFAILSDPGGAVSACLSAENCKAFLLYYGTNSIPEAYKLVELAVLSIYSIFLIWWTRVLIKSYGRYINWATENKWLLIAGVGLWTKINPLIIVLNYLNPGDRQKIWAAAYIISVFGQFMLVFAAACFSDAPRRYVVTRFNFYVFKLLYCLLLWGASTVVVLYTFPEALGREEPGDDLNIGGLGFLTSLENWPRRDQLFYCTFVGLIFGYIYYFWTSKKSIRILRSIPYNMTRPIQLSSRFFFWVTFLLVLLEVSTLSWDFANAHYEAQKEYSYLPNLTRWSLAFDGMHYSNQVMQFNTDVYKCFFLVIFQCLFLPPCTFNLEKNGKGKVYYKTEEEAEVHYKSSKETSTKYRLVSERAKLLMICATEVYLPLTVEERTALFPPEPEKEEAPKKSSFFRKTATSVSKATALATKTTTDFVSNTIKEINDIKEACTSPTNVVDSDVESTNNSNDSEPQISSLHSSSKSVHDINDNDMKETGRKDPRTDPDLIPESLDRLAGDPGYSPRMFPWEGSYALGCRVIARIFEPDGIDLHESRAMIFRHTPSGDLIVAFRGTKTKKQIKTDLMAGKVAVDLDTFLTIPTGRFCGLCCSVEDEEDFEQFEIPSSELEGNSREEKLKESQNTSKGLRDLLDKNTSMPDYLKDAYRAVDHFDQKIGHLHFGFWSSYSRLRKEIHQKVHDELVREPGRLLVTGHSLGGAQAYHCAYDMVRWVVPTVKRKLLMTKGRASSDAIEVSCYTFGAPRPGNRAYMKAYNKAVPDTQRIVCEGDVITSVPPVRMGFRHVGYESIFDVAGFVRVDPTLIEQNFSKKRTDLAAHATTNYRIAIERSFDPRYNEEDALDTLRVAYGFSPKNNNYNISGAPSMKWRTPENEASTKLDEAEEELAHLYRRGSVWEPVKQPWRLSNAEMINICGGHEGKQK